MIWNIFMVVRPVPSVNAPPAGFFQAFFACGFARLPPTAPLITP